MTPHAALRLIEKRIPEANQDDELQDALDVIWEYVLTGRNKSLNDALTKINPRQALAGHEGESYTVQVQRPI
jgi:hypothetical protein